MSNSTTPRSNDSAFLEAARVCGSTTTDAATGWYAGLMQAVPCRIDGVPYAVVPKDCDLHSLEHMLAAPSRRRMSAVFDRADSFVDYCRLNRTPTMRVFIREQGDGSGAVVFAIFDFPEPGATSWLRDEATYRTAFSAEWKAWHGINKRWLGQVDFAEFLEQWASCVSNPDPATLLEVARTLQAKRDVNFRSGTNLENGDTQLLFEETTTAKAGQKGTLEIPSRINLFLPLFHAGKPVQATAAFRYRISDAGRLTYSIDLLRPDNVINDGITALATQIAADLEITPWYGSINAT